MNLHDWLVGVVFVVCLACIVFAGGVHRPRDVFAIPAFADDDENVVHLASNLSSLLTPAVTKPFAWVVSSGTAGAIWWPLSLRWVSITRVLGLLLFMCLQRQEINGNNINNLITISV